MKARPEKDKRNSSLFSLKFFTYMQPQTSVQITVTCRDAAELQKAKEAILYHLETLNPDITVKRLRLTVRVVPIDPAYFDAEEACDIIRLTLAQSLTFTNDWKCTLHTTN